MTHPEKNNLKRGNLLIIGGSESTAVAMETI